MFRRVDEDPEQRMQDPAAVDADADKVQKARILERHARSTTERARRPSPGTRDRRENQTHWVGGGARSTAIEALDQVALQPRDG